MNKKITCRPCKEQQNWEIAMENGDVLDTHYNTKEACVKAGEKIAREKDCSLCVEEE
ncbi:MAG: DUF2188 domain-containing protein [Acholeplasmatales bacterium]|nr:DUF2188 domain-containing protein [Acholeplasmatales bacterium]